MFPRTTQILLIDAFTGEILRTLDDHRPANVPPAVSTVSIEACFSPCSRYVFSGSTDSKLCSWNAETGQLIARVDANRDPDDRSLCRVLKFNPTYYILASANVSTYLWVPLVTEEDENDDGDDENDVVSALSPAFERNHGDGGLGRV